MTSPLPQHEVMTRRITSISLAVALSLIALKAFATGASGSVSLMASLVDSCLDMIGSMATFFAVRWAAAKPDTLHRYGHGKAEALAALVQAGLVMASAVFIVVAAFKRFAVPTQVTGGMLPVVVIAISMAVTAWLIYHQTRVIKATGSLAISGDRAHYTSDLAANFVVLIGVVSGSLLKAPGLDAAAGFIVGIWLAWGGFNLMKDAANNLLDSAASDEDRNGVLAAVLKDERLNNVHQMRTRMVGRTMMIQMHVDLDPELTLAEAHDIVVAAEKRVLSLYPHADIIIHADPGGRRTSSRPDISIDDMDSPEPPAPAGSTTGPWG